MGYCERCGRYVQDHYTYCRDCYFELGQPAGMAMKKQHKCYGCGRSIVGKYNYCPECAIRKGYMKNGQY